MGRIVTAEYRRSPPARLYRSANRRRYAREENSHYRRRAPISLDRESTMESTMKLPKLRAEIRRIEAALKRMRTVANNLEIVATMPNPIAHDNPEFTQAAKERATVLFWRHLSPEQRGEFTRQRWFTVVGNQTGAKYRISPVRAAREEAGGTFARFYCLVICAEITPLEDVMLAKKIIIEKDEPLFLRTAVDVGVHEAEEFSRIVLRDGR